MTFPDKHRNRHLRLVSSMAYQFSTGAPQRGPLRPRKRSLADMHTARTYRLDPAWVRLREAVRERRRRLACLHRPLFRRRVGKAYARADALKLERGAR